MKATELRIGNWVEHDITKKVIQIAALDILHLDSNLSSVSSIPLTEEWLLKFGFRKLITKENFFIINEDSDNEFLYNIFNKDLYIDTGMVVQHLGVEIQYVHQLQNLYFALTGQELTIKESAAV